MTKETRGVVGKIVTLVLGVASVVVCFPYAFLAFALLIHAPNQWARLFAFCPLLLIFGAYFAVGWAWKKERWLGACLVLAALLGLFAYGWSTLELP